MFVDDYLVGNKSTRRSETGLFIFVNKDPINLYSKRQATIKVSTFGAEFCAMKEVVDISESLSCNL